MANIVGSERETDTEHASTENDGEQSAERNWQSRERHEHCEHAEENEEAGARH